MRTKGEGVFCTAGGELQWGGEKSGMVWGVAGGWKGKEEEKEGEEKEEGREKRRRWRGKKRKN